MSARIGDGFAIDHVRLEHVISLVSEHLGRRNADGAPAALATEIADEIASAITARTRVGLAPAVQDALRDSICGTVVGVCLFHEAFVRGPQDDDRSDEAIVAWLGEAWSLHCRLRENAHDPDVALTIRAMLASKRREFADRFLADISDTERERFFSRMQTVMDGVLQRRATAAAGAAQVQDEAPPINVNITIPLTVAMPANNAHPVRTVETLQRDAETLEITRIDRQHFWDDPAQATTEAPAATAAA